MQTKACHTVLENVCLEEEEGVGGGGGDETRLHDLSRTKNMWFLCKYAHSAADDDVKEKF